MNDTDAAADDEADEDYLRRRRAALRELDEALPSMRRVRSHEALDRHVDALGERIEQLDRRIRWLGLGMAVCILVLGAWIVWVGYRLGRASVYAVGIVTLGLAAGVLLAAWLLRGIRR